MFSQYFYPSRNLNCTVFRRQILFSQEIYNSNKIRRNRSEQTAKRCSFLSNKNSQISSKFQNLAKKKMEKASTVFTFSCLLYAEAFLCNYGYSYRQIKCSLKWTLSPNNFPYLYFQSGL